MSEQSESAKRDDADKLERALAAVSRQVEGQEMSPHIFTGILTKMREAADAKPSSTEQFIRRITTLTFRQGIAAAFMITLGGLSLWFVFSVFGRVTYAGVADRIRATRTVSYTETVSGGAVKHPVSMRTLCIEPDRVRNETSGGTSVMVLDRAAGKELMLNPSARTALSILIHTAGQPNPMEDMESYFQKLTDQAGQPIEDRQIGGTKAKGFHTESFGLPVSIWVDPKTKLPLLVEMSVPVGKMRVKVVLSDFVFDAPIDESLFSLQAPAGYKVTEMQLPLNK